MYIWNYSTMILYDCELLIIHLTTFDKLVYMTYLFLLLACYLHYILLNTQYAWCLLFITYGS